MYININKENVYNINKENVYKYNIHFQNVDHICLAFSPWQSELVCGIYSCLPSAVWATWITRT